MELFFVYIPISSNLWDEIRSAVETFPSSIVGVSNAEQRDDAAHEMRGELRKTIAKKVMASNRFGAASRVETLWRKKTDWRN